MSTAKLLKRAAPSTGASTGSFVGKWKNQLGSVMDLTVAGQQVTGIYESADSSGGNPITGDLLGYVDGDLIAFTVNWSGPASLTSWTGQLVTENGADTIKTLWLLVQNIAEADEPKKLWQSTFTGADNFVRT